MRRKMVIGLGVIVVVSGIAFVAAQQQTGSGSSGPTITPATKSTWNQVQAKMKAILSARATKDIQGNDYHGTEAPGSPAYFNITKTVTMKNAGHTKAQDGKDLLLAPFTAPGTIIAVSFSCTGPGDSCQHTYGCDAACTGHPSPWEISGPHGTWWGKTDDGNENLYTITVHYQ
jgi:hypothetical protein